MRLITICFKDKVESLSKTAEAEARSISQRSRCQDWRRTGKLFPNTGSSRSRRRSAPFSLQKTKASTRGNSCTPAKAAKSFGPRTNPQTNFRTTTTVIIDSLLKVRVCISVISPFLSFWPRSIDINDRGLDLTSDVLIGFVEIETHSIVELFDSSHLLFSWDLLLRHESGFFDLEQFWLFGPSPSSYDALLACRCSSPPPADDPYWLNWLNWLRRRNGLHSSRCQKYPVRVDWRLPKAILLRCDSFRQVKQCFFLRLFLEALLARNDIDACILIMLDCWKWSWSLRALILIVRLQQLTLSFPRASELRASDFQVIDNLFRDEITPYLAWINCSPAKRTGDHMLRILVVFAVLLKARLAKSMPK